MLIGCLPASYMNDDDFKFLAKQQISASFAKLSGTWSETCCWSQYWEESDAEEEPGA